MLSRHIIPYRSTSNNATENVKQSAKYYATAAEKVRMKKKAQRLQQSRFEDQEILPIAANFGTCGFVHLYSMAPQPLLNRK